MKMPRLDDFGSGSGVPTVGASNRLPTQTSPDGTEAGSRRTAKEKWAQFGEGTRQNVLNLLGTVGGSLMPGGAVDTGIGAISRYVSSVNAPVGRGSNMGFPADAIAMAGDRLEDELDLPSGGGSTQPGRGPSTQPGGEKAMEGEEPAKGDSAQDDDWLSALLSGETPAEKRLREAQAANLEKETELMAEKLKFEQDLARQRAAADKKYQEELIRIADEEQALKIKLDAAQTEREMAIAKGNWEQAAAQRKQEREIETERQNLIVEQRNLEQQRFDQEMSFKQGELEFNQTFAMNKFQLEKDMFTYRKQFEAEQFAFQQEMGRGQLGLSQTQTLAQIFSNPMALAAFARTGAQLPGGVQLPARPGTATGAPIGPQELARFSQQGMADRFVGEALGGVNPYDLVETGARNAPRSGPSVRRA